MNKELLSFIVIGLLVLAIWLITFARTKTTGILRFILSAIAFLLLIPAFLGMLVVVF